MEEKLATEYLEFLVTTERPNEHPGVIWLEAVRKGDRRSIHQHVVYAYR